MIVYCEHITPRVTYIFQQFFNFSGIQELEITSDLNNFINDSRNKISYSNQSVHDGINVAPYGLLAESGINTHHPIAEKWNGSICFFKTSSQGEFQFDIFSAAFFLISRYEEYLSFRSDEHGRFPADQSWMYKNNVLHLPLIDQWANYFSDVIQSKFPNEKIKKRKFTHRLTVDVDNAWAYLNKGFLRTTLQELKQDYQGRLKKNGKEKMC